MLNPLHTKVSVKIYDAVPQLPKVVANLAAGYFTYDDVLDMMRVNLKIVRRRSPDGERQEFFIADPEVEKAIIYCLTAPESGPELKAIVVKNFVSGRPDTTNSDSRWTMENQRIGINTMDPRLRVLQKLFYRSDLAINLVNADLSNLDLTGFDFSGVNAIGVKFRGAKLWGVKFCKANLTFSDFSGARLENADFSYANVERGIFRSARLEAAQFRGAQASRADFSHGYLRTSGWWHAELQCADFTDAHLSYAYMPGADLSGAIFRRTNLFGANLERAILTETGLVEVNTTSDSDCETGRFDSSSANLKRGLLTTFDLDHVKVAGAVFNSRKSLWSCLYL